MSMRSGLTMLGLPVRKLPDCVSGNRLIVATACLESGRRFWRTTMAQLTGAVDTYSSS